MSAANKFRFLGIMICHGHIGMYDIKRSNFCFLLAEEEVAYGRPRTIGADEDCSRYFITIFECGRHIDTIWAVR